MAMNAEDKLCQLVKNALQQTQLNVTHIKVCRKTKDLAHGDFFVPKGVLNVDLKSEFVKGLSIETTIRQETSEDTLPISSLSQDAHNSLVFHIDRQKAYNNIIREVLSAGKNYGSRPLRKEKVRVVVNPVDIHVHDDGDVSQQPVTLTQFRAVLLLKHTLQLFSANGYQAAIAKIPVSDNVQDLLDVLHVDVATGQKSVIEELCERLSLQAKASPYFETCKLAGYEESADDEKGKECVVLNVGRFMTSEDLLVGKTGYDKNLNLVKVKLEDGSLTDTVRKAAVVEMIASERQDSSETSTLCIHLTSQSIAWKQQQVDLVWRLCTQLTPLHLIQRHLVFGTVGWRKSCAAAVVDAKEFYNVRHRQMTTAAMVKHGDHDQGPTWDDMIARLTTACITFDLMMTACPSQVHVDLSEEDGEGGADYRSGPFVLYNCARLASLLSAFDSRVDQGVYPPLPDPEDIDFKLLREEEEWTLALLYIHTYPRLVQETLHNWDQEQGIAANIATHKVSHFLLSFAKTLSSYYSRYHILGGSEAHLLPLMYARLSLMKAAHQVLCNALQLLGLQPFSWL